MKVSQFKDKSVADLQSELLALMKELFNLRIQKGLGQFSQTHLFRNVKKNIARIKTVLREKEGSQS